MSKQQLTSVQRQEARGWIEDAFTSAYLPCKVDVFSDREVEGIVRDHYEGGLAGFIEDTKALWGEETS